VYEGAPQFTLSSSSFCCFYLDEVRTCVWIFPSPGSRTASIPPFADTLPSRLSHVGLLGAIPSATTRHPGLWFLSGKMLGVSCADRALHDRGVKYVWFGVIPFWAAPGPDLPFPPAFGEKCFPLRPLHYLPQSFFISSLHRCLCVARSFRLVSFSSWPYDIYWESLTFPPWIRPGCILLPYRFRKGLPPSNLAFGYGFFFPALRRSSVLSLCSFELPHSLSDAVAPAFSCA